MRVSEGLVVQQVGGELVLIDDLSGSEATMPIAEIPLLVNRLYAAWVGEAPGVELAEVAIWPADFLRVTFALGYFWGTAASDGRWSG
jgi:hypothetical protein